MFSGLFYAQNVLATGASSWTPCTIIVQTQKGRTTPYASTLSPQLALLYCDCCHFLSNKLCFAAINARYRDLSAFLT